MATSDKLVRIGVWPAEADLQEGDFQSGVTALGASQATATVLTADNTLISSAAASTGVILRGVYGRQVVFNGGGSAVAVYPPVGGKINAGATNAAFSVGAGKSAQFVGDGVTFIAILSA